MKLATRLSVILLALVCIGHFARVLFGVDVTAAGRELPMWVSVVVFLATGALAIGLWRENSRRA